MLSISSDALRDRNHFHNLKSVKENLWKTFTFSKVADLSLQIY